MSTHSDDPNLLMGVDGRAEDAPVEPPPPWLAEAIQALPEAIEPERDLWSGIEDALSDGAPTSSAATPAASRRHPVALIALAAAAALLATVGTGARLVAGSSESSSASPPQVAATEPNQDTARIAPPGTTSWTGDIERANAALHAQLEARDDLSPEARAAIDANLERIDAAIAEIRALLDDRPADPELRRWLSDTEELKQRLLVSALHLPEGS